MAITLGWVKCETLNTETSMAFAWWIGAFATLLTDTKAQAARHLLIGKSMGGIDVTQLERW
jgi:hypothetical protein